MKYILALIFIAGLSFSAFAIDSNKPLAKDFSAKSLDGKTITLNEEKGKVVVLTFWSTTCLICSGELPRLSRMVDKMAGKKVVFLALSVENETKVGEYIKKKPFSSIIIPNSFGIFADYSEKDAGGNYNIEFPTFFVINQAGEIEMKTSGRNKLEAIDNQINQLLGS